jgi:hypothetical protein
MSCTDLADWYLSQRVGVLDVRTAAFRRALSGVVPPRYHAEVCLVAAGRMRRIRGGRMSSTTSPDPIDRDRQRRVQ